MKRQSFVALGVAFALAAGAIGLRASNVVVLSEVGTPGEYSAPIGIDWLPLTDSLLISDHYASGLPDNFTQVDRTTGNPVVWGSANGWGDEIYFASVRPQSPSAAAGWTVGRVYSAKGGVHNNLTTDFGDPTASRSLMARGT